MGKNISVVRNPDNNHQKDNRVLQYKSKHGMWAPWRTKMKGYKENSKIILVYYFFGVCKDWFQATISKLGSPKYNFQQNIFYTKQKQLALKRYAFIIAFYTGYRTQLVIFHWATTQLDTSLKEKIPHNTNSLEKTPPPPKEQHIPN